MAARQGSGMLKESRLLLKRWLRNPLRIGTVTASSRELAEAVARQVSGIGAGYIVELGGGTGPITQALLDSGIAPERLVVVECDPVLHRHLTERFPHIRVLLGDAAQLAALLQRHGVAPVGAIASGLPLLAMKKSVQHRIALQAFRVLEPNAPFVQFTYGLFSPLPRRRLGLRGRLEARVLNNLPPANVWRYERPARPERS